MRMKQTFIKKASEKWNATLFNRQTPQCPTTLHQTKMSSTIFSLFLGSSFYNSLFLFCSIFLCRRKFPQVGTQEDTFVVVIQCTSPSKYTQSTLSRRVVPLDTVNLPLQIVTKFSFISNVVFVNSYIFSHFILPLPFSANFPSFIFPKRRGQRHVSQKIANF